MRNTSIFATLLTLTLNTLCDCYVYYPYYEESNESQLYPRSGDDSPYMSSNSRNFIFNPIGNYFGKRGTKTLYSVFVPLDNQPLHDLMQTESRDHMDITRRSGKGSKNFNKQFGKQFSNAFSGFGTAFGESFGSDFANHFGQLSKSSKVAKQKPKHFSKGFGSGFFGSKGSNIGKKFKMFFKSF